MIKAGSAVDGTIAAKNKDECNSERLLALALSMIAVLRSSALHVHRVIRSSRFA